MDRIAWDDYFMKIALTVAERSGCIKRGVGSVIVKDKRILATGYNSAPCGVKECKERGYCLRANSKQGKDLDFCYAVHSEQNAILQLAKYGIVGEGSTIYVTLFPCVHCMKLIINCGIKEIVYLEDYNSALSKHLAELSGIKIRKFKEDK